MSTRTLPCIVILLVLAFVSESAPPQRFSAQTEQGGSGEIPQDVPNSFEEDENLPKLGSEFFEKDDFGSVLNPDSQPPDYGTRNPLENDYNNELDSNRTGKQPEISPDTGNDEQPFEESDDNGEDNEIHKRIDKEAGINVSKDEDLDKSLGGEDKSIEDKVDKEDGINDSKDEDLGESLGGEDNSIVDKVDEEDRIDDSKDEDLDKPLDEEIKSIEDKDSKYPFIEDQDKSVEDDGGESRNNQDGDDGDEPPKYDTDDDSDEVAKDVEEEAQDAEENGFFNSFMFSNPFLKVRPLTSFFQQMEKYLEHMFRHTASDAAAMNGSYANTTDEEVEIHGKKYIVRKSIIKGKDNFSSIYIEALSAKPKPNDIKDVNTTGL